MTAKGILYLVPTPIGNLSDITYRAVETLKKVDFIGAEDTRKSAVLLKYYDIVTPQISYHKFNEAKRAEEFVKLISQGKNIAIICDAGSPGISDPSAIIVRAALLAHIKVEALPGATAFIPGLTASGLDPDRFCFLGFLPEKKKAAEELLTDIAEMPLTLIFYVSPHDLEKFAQILLKFLGDRTVCLAREISKIYEEYIHTNLKNLTNANDITLKGEFVAIVSGKQKKEVSDETLLRQIVALTEKGLSKREIINTISTKENISPNRIKKIIY
jgi:16S rRNA (cytidine1402-2'-O)-methyltransferase